MFPWCDQGGAIEQYGTKTAAEELEVVHPPILGTTGRLARRRRRILAIPPFHCRWLPRWHLRHPQVLDDLDGLYGSRDGIRLLKCLTQTEPQKSVSWYTDAVLPAAAELRRNGQPGHATAGPLRAT